ncbi:acyltransferase [Lacisediminihabitans sp.]|jgi:peptidoglycan/LPS O-acetylase OafA/YrhL|uniref:acyltransferase family protein n=1 Tax=Lacisediminihabitans sp. TaxID=2787631 RepID=UPI002F93C464
MTLQTTIERQPTATPAKSAGSSTRLTALDGLRGVAAMVVVLYHLYLVAEPVLLKTGGSGVGSAIWWISQTPLKLFSAGSEAVLVFFVLSGLVVALPALGSKGFSWAGFLSGRLARLYIPVWVSIAIGTALVWMIPRDQSAVTPGTWMDKAQATSISWGTLLDEASLTRASYDVNNVLWSLRWELVFSVLLPLFVALAIIARRRWAIAIAAALVVSTVGVVAGIDAFQYLPVFFIGTIMAVRLDAIREWTKRRLLRPHSRRWGAALVVGSLLLLVAHSLARPIVQSGSVADTLLTQLSVLGAAGLVLAAIGVRPVRSALESRPSQWLGRVSFSLYLVHMPILATLTFLLGDERWWLVALLTVPAALLTAWGFHRAVERPSHRLARRITRAVTTGVDSHRARSSKAA